MRRIVMVNTVPGGSHGRILRDLSGAAARAGFETEIAVGRGASGTSVPIGGRMDVLTHVALTRLLDRHGLGSRRATRAFIRYLEAAKPELVHLHNIHGYYLNAEALFAYLRASGVPVVWTLHDCWPLTGHCSHFIRANCDRWKTGCHHCPLKAAYPASRLIDASRDNYRWKKAAFSGMPRMTVVTPSHWLDGVVAESCLSGTPRRVIPNGVDLSLFAPSRSAEVRERAGVLPGQAMLLAVAAPFDARKGFSDALRVAESLGAKARLILVGLTEKQIAMLPKGVTGMTRTDGPEDLVALYGAADCLINPTYEDTYPTVNMEAMASGTPVAAYAVGGCTEQLAAPVGRAVPVGDAEALARAAMALAGAKDALAAPCRAYAEEHFDRGRAAGEYIALYQRMLEGK